jgi:hypothetical protein
MRCASALDYLGWHPESRGIAGTRRVASVVDDLRRAGVRFCGDEELGYERSRTRFVPGQGLALDDAYRLAHLPLVAPDHPRVIPAREGTYYDRGRHPRVYSLVLPVPWPTLAASPVFGELDGELRSASFAPKIAWEAMERRRERVHATICGSLAVEPGVPPAITAIQRRDLEALGPIAVELRGLFSGNVNVGRLYLRVYPERRGGTNMLRAVQRIMGWRETDLYVVGLYNLTDDLNAVEAAAFAGMVERWWERLILRLELSHLWLLWAHDDLVLDGGILESVPLVQSP